MEMEVAARRPAVPPGYRFTPTPEELIRYYLNPWVTGQDAELFPGVVIAADIYALDPDALTSRFAHAGHDGNWYFLCAARWKGGKAGTRMNRCVSGGGTWHGSSKRKKVGEDGHRQGFEYRAAGDKKTAWIMEEFVTNLKEASDGEGVRVICKVHRSPRAAAAAVDEEEKTSNNMVGSKKRCPEQLHGENGVDQCYYATTTSAEAGQATEEEASNKVGCGSKKRPKQQLHEENNVECYYATTSEAWQAAAEEESYELAGSKSKRRRLHGEQQHGLAACTVTVAPPPAEARYYYSYAGASRGAAAAASTTTTLHQQSVMERGMGFYYPNSVNGRVGIGDGEPEQSPVEREGMEGNSNGLSRMDYSLCTTADGVDVNEWFVNQILGPREATDGV